MTKLLLASILAAMLAIAGIASADELPDPRCFRVEGSIIGQDEIGMTNGGLRVDLHMEGVTVDGLLTGLTGTASSRNLIRHDGVAEFDMRMFATLPTGGAIAFTVFGYGPPAGPTLAEMLEAMADPDFVQPDVYEPWHGAARFETMIPEYAFLNHSVYWVVGEANLATGHMRFSYCPIAP